MKIQYRFLSDENFSELYETNLAAFSDYVVPIKLTKEQFHNHIVQNNIDLELSVGAFRDDNLIGYTLNGFGLWNSKKTAYDGGTGVIPNYRRTGVGTAMFEFLLPKLREIGVQQMLLEVISTNNKAINLYRKLGFLESRRLLFFEQTDEIKEAQNGEFVIKQIDEFDWNQLEQFWDKSTSWQFSIDSVKRKPSAKFFFGAFFKNKLIGYGLFYPTSGTISQLAVNKEFRRKKLATMLLVEMQKYLENNIKLRFSNVDRELKNVIKFAGKLNFTPTISQYEMILDL